MIKIVQKGFITRFNKEDEWEQDLIKMEIGEECIDGDAIPYYQEVDGKFYEYYDYYVKPGMNIYKLASEAN